MMAVTKTATTAKVSTANKRPAENKIKSDPAKPRSKVARKSVRAAAKSPRTATSILKRSAFSSPNARLI
jgi:hypothetical protein